MTTFPFDENEFFKAGREVWFEMRGPAAAGKAMEEAGQHEMTRDLRQYLFEHCFGAVWNRPGLERSTRSTITISVLTALGRTAVEQALAVVEGETVEETVPVPVETVTAENVGDFTE